MLISCCFTVENFWLFVNLFLFLFLQFLFSFGIYAFIYLEENDSYPYLIVLRRE